MKNKWLIIGIAVVVIVLGMLACQPAPTTPTAPTPVQTAPAATNEPAPAGVIKITAEKLVRELAADWTKYKRGTVFQVSGVFVARENFYPDLRNEIEFFLGPVYKTSVGNLGVKVNISLDKEPELFKAFAEIKGGSVVVVRGTYFTFNNSNEEGVILKNVSLISVAPAK